MADETAPRTDLADLTRPRLAELRLSYRKAAELSIDPESPGSGPQWTRCTLENLAKGLVVKAPRPEALRALASVLKLPLGLVQDAAAGQFLDIDTVRGEDDGTRLMIRHYRSLSSEDRERLIAIAEAWGRPPGPA